MNKLRKGSIAWDCLTRSFVKILTKPGSGELPDNLMNASGVSHDPKIFGAYVLVKVLDPASTAGYMLHNNQPCRCRKLIHLIPRKLALTIKDDVIKYHESPTNKIK